MGNQLSFLPDDVIGVPTSATGRPADFDIRYKPETRKWRLSQQASDAFGRDNGISVKYSQTAGKVYMIVAPLAQSEVWKGKSADSNRGLEFSHTKLKAFAKRAGLQFVEAKNADGKRLHTDFKLQYVGQEGSMRVFTLEEWEGDSGILDLDAGSTSSAPTESDVEDEDDFEDEDEDVVDAEVLEDDDADFDEDDEDGEEEDDEEEDFDFD